mgnify:FL=1
MNNHSESTEAYIGYYSKKQHAILKEHNNRPYIYYKNCDGKIKGLTDYE